MKKSSVFDASSNALKKIINNHKASSSKDSAQAPTPNSVDNQTELTVQLNQKRQALSDAQQKIERLQLEVDSNRKQSAQIDHETEEAQTKLEQAQAKKAQAQQDLQSATIENINQLSQKISNKQNDILLDQQNISKLENTKETTSKRSQQEEAQIKRLNEQKQLLEEEQIKAQKTVNGANQIVNSEERAVADAKVAISNTDETNIKAARYQLQNKQIDLNTAKYKLRGAQRELANVQENLEEVENKTSLLQGDTAKALQATKIKLEKDQQLLVEYQDRLSVLQNANNHMQTVKADLRKAEEEVNQIERRHERMRQVLAEKINELTNAKRAGLDIQKQIETLQAQIKAMPEKQPQDTKTTAKPSEQNQRLPQVGEVHHKHHMPLFKVAALTVSEILTRLDLGLNHKKRK